MKHGLKDAITKLKNLNLFYKFFIAIFLLGLITVTALSFWFYNTIQNALIERTFAQLQSVNVLKKQQVQMLFASKDPQISEINAIMQETTGMGNSGETYIVKENFRMLTYSRFFPTKNPEYIVVKTEASQNALKGNEGHSIVNDYRNIPVFSVYSKITLPGYSLAIMSEIDYVEAIRPVREFRTKILWIAIATLILVTMASFYVTRIVVERLKILQEPIIKLSKGEIPQQLLTITDRDEIGNMMESVNILIRSFDKISKVANEIGKGNLNFYFKPLSKNDLLSYSLLKMRQQLSDFSEKEKKLQRQRTYSLLEGEERERKRIARELHDSLGQMLTGLRFRLEIVENENQRLELKKITDETISELKQIINNLMPTVLADFGLEAGLRSLCERFRSYNKAEIIFFYDRNEVSPTVPFEVSIFMYRIAQEVLNNAMKYANASKISVSVDEFNNKICLFIKDNGHGFDTQAEYQGNGLKNIKERVTLLQGLLEIESNSDGTTVNIEIPL